MFNVVLSKSEWSKLQADHHVRVAQWTCPFRERRRRGKSHPVHDFLFVYYQYSPAKLEQWHPGIGVGLKPGGPLEFDQRCYTQGKEAFYCDVSKITDKKRMQLDWIASLLNATYERRGNFSCFGMHEWAMVYQAEDIRHEKTTPLRLPQSEINQIVESRPIACSHFDAFRFFADSARPLNKLQPTLDSRIELEQPGCIHANMDLYKWAFKSMPWIGSELLLKCFELALEARAVDMRASPYDLSEYGDQFQPIKIETPDGRIEYEDHQKSITKRAQALRLTLSAAIQNVLDFQHVHENCESTRR